MSYQNIKRWILRKLFLKISLHEFINTIALSWMASPGFLCIIASVNYGRGGASAMHQLLMEHFNVVGKVDQGYTIGSYFIASSSENKENYYKLRVKSLSNFSNGLRQDFLDAMLQQPDRLISLKVKK